MIYSIIGFLTQLSMLYLLTAMFILLDILLLTVRLRRWEEERKGMSAAGDKIRERSEKLTALQIVEAARLAQRPARGARSPIYGQRRQPLIDAVREGRRRAMSPAEAMSRGL